MQRQKAYIPYRQDVICVISIERLVGLGPNCNNTLFIFSFSASDIRSALVDDESALSYVENGNAYYTLEFICQSMMNIK